MARNDDLVTKAFIAKRKIESGSLDLAESIAEISKTKLYRLKYKTFAEFCEEELGFSRQTIYVYLSILQLVSRYGSFIDRDKAIDYGHKKMRHITEGFSAIDKSSDDPGLREKKKVEIFQMVDPRMPSTEIEAIIEDVVNE
jgi:hypothetical protein